MHYFLISKFQNEILNLKVKYVYKNSDNAFYQLSGHSNKIFWNGSWT